MSVPPRTIQFMLACYFSPNPAAVLRDATWNCGAGREARRWLQENGLLDEDHRPTSRGKAWVKYISSTPLPVPADTWSLPPRQPTVEEDWEKPIQQAAE
jgi:hypothetical protein